MQRMPYRSQTSETTCNNRPYTPTTMAFIIPGKVVMHAELILSGLWRNGSASDSRSEGWEFESLWPHPFMNKYCTQTSANRNKFARHSLQNSNPCASKFQHALKAVQHCMYAWVDMISYHVHNACIHRLIYIYIYPYMYVCTCVNVCATCMGLTHENLDVQPKQI